MRNKIAKIRTMSASFTVAYDFPRAHRMKNSVDRLMDRYLFTMRYFHGKEQIVSEYSIRSWALIYNFSPSNPITVRLNKELKSPAERLNRYSYHDNWVQNLLISVPKRAFFILP